MGFRVIFRLPNPINNNNMIFARRALSTAVHPTLHKDLFGLKYTIPVNAGTDETSTGQINMALSQLIVDGLSFGKVGFAGKGEAENAEEFLDNHLKTQLSRMGRAEKKHDASEFLSPLVVSILSLQDLIVLGPSAFRKRHPIRSEAIERLISAADREALNLREATYLEAAGGLLGVAQVGGDFKNELAQMGIRRIFDKHMSENQVCEGDHVPLRFRVFLLLKRLIFVQDDVSEHPIETLRVGDPLAIYFTLLLVEGARLDGGWMRLTAPHFSFSELDENGYGNYDGSSRNVIPPNFFDSMFNIGEELTAALLRIYLAVGRFENLYTPPALPDYALDSNNIDDILKRQHEIKSYLYYGEDDVLDDTINLARSKLEKAVEGDSNFSALETISRLHELSIPFEAGGEYIERGKSWGDVKGEGLMPLPPFISGNRNVHSPIQPQTRHDETSERGFFDILFFGSCESENKLNDRGLERINPPPPLESPCISSLGTCLKSHDQVKTFAGATGGIGGDMFTDCVLYGLGASFLMSQSLPRKGKVTRAVAQSLRMYDESFSGLLLGEGRGVGLSNQRKGVGEANVVEERKGPFPPRFLLSATSILSHALILGVVSIRDERWNALDRAWKDLLSVTPFDELVDIHPVAAAAAAFGQRDFESSLQHNDDNQTLISSLAILRLELEAAEDVLKAGDTKMSASGFRHFLLRRRRSFDGYPSSEGLNSNKTIGALAGGNSPSVGAIFTRAMPLWSLSLCGEDKVVHHADGIWGEQSQHFGGGGAVDAFFLWGECRTRAGRADEGKKILQWAENLAGAGGG